MKVQIAKLLLKEELLTEEQLKEALEAAKDSETEITEALFELGYISENELLDFLGKSFGVPVISIEEHSIVEEVLNLIPREIALENKLIPLNITGSALTVAMSDPSNIILRDELSFLTEKNIIPVVVSERSVINMLENYYSYSGKKSEDSEKEALALEEMLKELNNQDSAEDQDKDKDETISISGEKEEVEASDEISINTHVNTEQEEQDKEKSIAIADDADLSEKEIPLDDDPSMFAQQPIVDNGSLDNLEEDDTEAAGDEAEDQPSAYTLTSPGLSSTLAFESNEHQVPDNENGLEDQRVGDQELTVQSNSVNESDLNTNSEGQRVLIIDHSLTVQKLIALSLGRKGYSVSAVSDGMEALSRLHDLKPDLIFIEINLPHMDGYKVCKIIKSHGLMKKVPIVMMAGREGLFDKMRSKMAGANGHIKKPFSLNDIAESARSFTVTSHERAASA